MESKYTYDAPANTNTMAYDGMGNRVKKLNPVAGNTVYVYNAFGELAAEYAGGAGIACSPCYLFQDAVGSTRLMVNQNQAVVRRYDSMPFGEEIYNGAGWANGRTAAEYAATSALKLRYGGGYKDDQSGEWPVTLLGARGYDPRYGRFVTPDENLIDQNAADPLSWNLFAYARNNPLVYMDPSGRACVNNVDSESGNSCVDVEGLAEKVQTAKKVITGSLLLLEPSIRMPGRMADKTMEAVQEWMGRPRDPGCMARAMGVGSTVGWWAGGGLGATGFAGGPTGLATAPAGAAAGAAGGGAMGGAAGLVICSTGGGSADRLADGGTVSTARAKTGKKGAEIVDKAG